MNRNYPSLAAALLLSALIGGMAQSAEPASDAQITDHVLARITQDNPDMARRVQVATKDGVVTLSGSAYSGAAALKALQDARSVEGVVKVQNRLSIQE
ncbi:MAG TPA: BON domain-containing protein [Steroidobacteraceae bacterium]|nr:BON domain-containing protein [Steroidobacteraceae bacterium]